MDLKILGLNDYESKVYEAVISLGTAGASQISKVSEVPYGRIYDILASLENKGFISLLPGKIKQYASSDPQNLVASIKKRYKELKDVEDSVKRLKQIYEQRENEPIVIRTGKANFMKILKELEKGEKIDYLVKWTSEARPEWIRSVKENIDEGKDIKTLTRYDKETKNDVQKFRKVQPQIRKIENDGVAMEINEKNIMIAMIKSNTTMIIRDKPFIDLMRKMFLALYEKSEEIPLE